MDNSSRCGELYIGSSDHFPFECVLPKGHAGNHSSVEPEPISGAASTGKPPDDEVIIGAFCPSIAECAAANKCLQDCHNKPHPAIVPSSFPEAARPSEPSANYVSIVDHSLVGNPSCHVCGAIMVRCAAPHSDQFGCGSCGATTGCSEPEPVAGTQVEPTDLRVYLKWALDYIADGVDYGMGETPQHDCEFTSNPEKGACDFHEKFHEAVFALDASVIEPVSGVAGTASAPQGLRPFEDSLQAISETLAWRIAHMKLEGGSINQITDKIKSAVRILHNSYSAATSCKGCQNDSAETCEHDDCLVDKVLDKELGRWQQAIYELCRKHAIAPDCIDGGGTDSGDPLDFTLSEIGQVICQLENPQDYGKSAGSSVAGTPAVASDVQRKLIGSLLTRWELMTNDFKSVVDEQERDFYAAMHELVKSVDSGEFWAEPAQPLRTPPAPTEGENHGS